MTTSNYQKYQTSNPLMQKVIGRFQEKVFTIAADLRPSSIIDLGCGEGVMLNTLKPLGGFNYLGIERNPVALNIAKKNHPGFDFIEGDILNDLRLDGAYDLAICLEVLEHLEQPAKAVEQISNHTTCAAIISVPWEPYFQIGNFFRGKYLSTLGNHPEHIQHFNPKSFVQLLAPHFTKVDVIGCFPWMIAVCKKITIN